jgi:SAM-dependent methyltransferase
MTYTIQGGARDAGRLARQAGVMAAASEAFLARVGLGPGWSCLDVGCGSGQVTLHLARQAGPGGRAVGVDLDEDALEIARGAAAQAGLPATFVRADAAAPPERGAFDLAYARLVLSHLADPMAAIRGMRDAVRPGGVVAVEDIDATTVHSIPASPAFGRLAEIYGATVRAHGGDPTIGPRLPALLAGAGLEGVAAQVVVNRMTTVDEKVFLAELVDNMREAIIGCGAADAAEVDALWTAIEAGARDPGTVFCQAAIHQVRGARPAEVTVPA